MLQGEDLLFEALPLRREDHFEIIFVTFLDTDQLAGGLDLETSMNKLNQRYLIIFLYFVEQFHEHRVFLLELLVLL
jgi:hypothetical protein